ncbi:TPA: hypothetical protein ACJIWE_000709 [Enterobacter roggenkampii]
MRLEQAFIIDIDVEDKENGTLQLSQTSDKPGRGNENETVLIDKKGAEGLIKHLQRFVSGE